MNVLTSPKGALYGVVKPLGITDEFNTHLCKLPDGREGILKIASIVEHNGVLDREAYRLNLLKEEADAVEKEYAERMHGKQPLNYHFYFPKVEESFVSGDQGGRRVIILSFSDISAAVGELTPLSHLTSYDHLRVDPRSSAWILGKLLKLLVFTHSLGISIGRLSGDNILINHEQHYVSLFDWGGAEDLGKMTTEVACKEISQITREVILALGGDPETGKIPEDDQLADSRYQEFLIKLLLKNDGNAQKAHKEFYELIRSLWPSAFHPFTTYGLR